jgi:esterase/lipase superfamily enzyme
MELLAFGHDGEKVLVFPTREGRFFDYENWGLVGALKDRIEEGSIRLFCVDSVDSESLYCRSIAPPARVERHRQYERYILEDVLPLMRSATGREALVAHGCSIGAYHAMNIALRHPHLFSKVVALSGRFDLSRPVGPFEDLFGGHYDQDVYFITPNHFMVNLEEPQILSAIRKLEIQITVGVEDPFRESNQLLSGAFTAKDVPHRLAFWPGEAHRAKYWRQMVPLYL